MTIAQKPSTAITTPLVSHFVNYGTKASPYGELYFESPDENIVISFKDGRVWAKRGGFAVKSSHYRAAYVYLVRAGVKRYRQFARDRVGKSLSTKRGLR